MVKERKKLWPIIVILLFIAYFLIAARPVPRETVLEAQWLSSLDSGTPLSWHAPGSGFEAADRQKSDAALPFILGGHFGYVDSYGQFPINEAKQGLLSVSDLKWTEYEAEPAVLIIRNSRNEIIETIDDPRGYPMFLDNQTFIINSEQNAISKTNGAGTVLWTYEFSAPLTCVDSAAGLVLTGSLDGMAEVLDAQGKLLFSFEPGGSRYAVILGCAFSHDARRFALVCGIDKQRFLLFERFGSSGGEYKIIYHEFLDGGFRRPVYVSFIDRDRRVIYERGSGLGIYEINARRGNTIALEGEAAAIDDSGDGHLFVIAGNPLSENKRLVGINLPGKIFMSAPFKSADVFLKRSGSRLIIGGGSTLASFKLEKK